VLSALTNLRYGEGALEVVTEALAVPQEPLSLPGPPIDFRHDIHFDHVTYSYPTTDAPALADVAVTIVKGQRIGVVGHSGGGKSTFVDLLAGLLHPTSGQILVDGNRVDDRLHAWREQIGYVPQAVYLLDDSVTANVAFGVPDAEVDTDVVWQALEWSQMADIVRDLPEGLDTRVGERGVRFSGGQRQRIAVARALYRRPSILLFDEATAALDNKLEEDMTVAIEALPGSHTVVIVAHRLSTVRRCDQLLLFDKGVLAAVGTYEELLERSDSFRELATIGLS
jgi:ABC-type multidrug transport system fused ATPase/permease subunit